jgi:hypothetical protein
MTVIGGEIVFNDLNFNGRRRANNSASNSAMSDLCTVSLLLVFRID